MYLRNGHFITGCEIFKYFSGVVYVYIYCMITILRSKLYYNR